MKRLTSEKGFPRTRREKGTTVIYTEFVTELANYITESAARRCSE